MLSDVVMSNESVKAASGFIPLNLVVPYCLKAPNRLVLVVDSDYRRLCMTRQSLEEEAINRLGNLKGLGGVTFDNGSRISFACVDSDADRIRGLEISRYSGIFSSEMKEMLETRCRRRDEDMSPKVLDGIEPEAERLQQIKEAASDVARLVRGRHTGDEWALKVDQETPCHEWAEPWVRLFAALDMPTNRI